MTESFAQELLKELRKIRRCLEDNKLQSISADEREFWKRVLESHQLVEGVCVDFDEFLRILTFGTSSDLLAIVEGRKQHSE